FRLEIFRPYLASGLAGACAPLPLFFFWWLGLEYGPPPGPDEPVNTNPFPHIRRFLAQPRLVLAWVLNFGRETWWVAFFVYTPIKMKEMLADGTSIGGGGVPGGVIGGGGGGGGGARRVLCAPRLVVALAAPGARP